MEDGILSWFDLMVQLPLSNFFKIILQSLWAPHWVKIECAPRGTILHQKMNVLILFYHVPEDGSFERRKNEKK
jgi:hypothetical protein